MNSQKNINTVADSLSGQQARKSMRKRSKRSRRGPKLESNVRTMTDAEAAVVSSMRQMVIPTNEQDRLARIVNMTEDQQLAKYVATIFNPKASMGRIPDSFPRPTALVRSIASFDLSVNLDATANSGRFAVAVQPTLGNLSGPQAYKLALVDTSSGWPTDFTVPESFVGIINGRDVRLDQFYQTLTQPPLGCVFIEQGTGATSGIPFGSDPITASGYGLSYSYANATGIFTLPIGIYTLSVVTEGIPANNAHVSVITAGEAIYAEQANQVSVDHSLSSSLGYLSIYGTSGRVSFQTVAGNPNFACLMLSTTFDDQPALLSPDDAGIVTEYRPVGMSALATYVGSSLNNGGNIAAAYVPGNTLQSQYFTMNVTSPQGLLENWENLALVPTAYNGELKTGAYVWWSPESVRDIEIAPPSTWNKRIPPSLIISGQYAPGTDLTGMQAVVRLEVVTVYELATNSQLWELSPLVGSMAAFDKANKLLSGEPHAMANAAHASAFQRFLGKVTGAIGKAGAWAMKNKDWLVPGAQAIGSLLL